MLKTFVGRLGGRRGGGLPARRDLRVDLHRLQARARGVAAEDPVRHRADRQGVPQRDQPAQLHLPLARVRAGRAGVLLPPVARARSGSSTGSTSASASTASSASARTGCACGPHDRRARALREGRRRLEFLFPFGWQEIEGVHDRGDWDLVAPRRVLGQGPLGARRGDQGALHADGDRDLGRHRPHRARAALQRLRGGEARGRRDAHGAARSPRRSRRSRRRCCRSRRSSPSPRSASLRDLRRSWNVFYDEAGNIGRRYRRQDEVGTPFCVTYDFESETDGKVTVRERDIDGARTACRSRGLAASSARASRSLEHEAARSRGSARSGIRRGAERGPRRLLLRRGRPTAAAT